jgi:hypothetical protein
MYFAVVGDDLVLLIGEHRFTAIHLSDGGYAWPNAPFVAIPGGGTPCGRGMFDGSNFYLPTSDPELLTIQVATGQVIKRIELSEPLGNLIALTDHFISQNEGKCAFFDLKDRSATVTAVAIPSNNELSALTPAQLIEKWGSSQFPEREAATQKLLERKDAAISALGMGTRSSNPEVAFRSACVLVYLLDATDQRVASEARRELLSAASAGSPYRFAHNEYARESRRRGPQAILELEKLGATVTSAGRSVTLPPTWQGQNEGLRHLAWLTDLETLELRHSAVNDLGLTHLRRLPNLKSLNLNRSQITNEGLRTLADLPKIETLLLQGTQIDDGAIGILGNLKQLKAMNLANTQISAAGVEKLQQLLPDLKIVY